VQAAEEGPTSPPPRDCVRQPGKGVCSCKEIIAATAAETYACEVKLQSLEIRMPDIASINFLTKFDHPLMNTFLEMKANSSAWRSRIGFNHPDWDDPGPSDSYEMFTPRKECRKCMLRIAHETPHPRLPNEETPAEINQLTALGGPPGDDSINQGVDDGEVNFFQQMLNYGRKMTGLQKSINWNYRGARSMQPYSYDDPPKYEPEEFGWRIFDESPDWSAVLRGMCTPEEITDMEEGLTYFWSCDSNRIKLDHWSRKTTDVHPRGDH
jgi:hypothetical protein